MTMSRIQVKITNVDTATQTLAVIWACDQSNKPIDEYSSFSVSLSNISANTTSTTEVIQQLAQMGIQECERQIREESALPTDTALIDGLIQQVGVVNEFDISTLTLPQLPTLPAESSIPVPTPPV